MYTLTTPMQTALAPRLSSASISRNRVLVFEVYESGYFPDVDGIFDPADAIALWAKTSLTWLGHDYERRILSHSPISQFMTGKFDNVTLTIDNAQRYFASFINTNQVDGMRLVVRYINLDYSATLADSLQRFVGRLEAPDSEIEGAQGDLTAQDELASLDREIPRRKVSAEDPEGRSPNDPLYEGFQFNARPSSVRYVETTIGTRFGIFPRRRETIKYNQWSSESGINEQVLPLILGRVQMAGIPVFWVDIGFYTIGLFVWAGHKVTAIMGFKLPDETYYWYGWWSDEAHRQTHVHLGDPGGTGTNATPDNIEHNYDQNTALLSRTAYAGLAPAGPEPETQAFANPSADPVATVVATVLGEADLPDGSGVFNQKGFTDSVVYLARFVLTSPDFFGLDSRLVNDSELVAVHSERSQPIYDKSNGELLYLTGYDALALQNGLLTRLNSTGLLSPLYYNNQVDPGEPDPLTANRLDAVPIFIDPGDPFGCDPLTERWNPITQTCEPIITIPRTVPAVLNLRRKFTLNLPITDTVNLLDFLNDVILFTGRLYLTSDHAGRKQIRAKKASDSTYLVSDASIAATSIIIANVEPWIASNQGYVLINPGLTTSEYRAITAAQYNPTIGNAMGLVVSDASLTPSGATLSGGSTSVPSSGTVTVSSVAIGTELIVTVWDIPIKYTVSASDTTESIAAMLCASINADPNLRQYVRAVWGGAAVLTIYATVGTLSFTTPLVNAHLAQLDSPVTAPTASATGSGTLEAGDYYLGFTDVDGSGNETLMSPLTNITISSGQKVSVSSAALPAGVAERNWYFSPAKDDDHVQFLLTNTGGAFTIDDVADHDADYPPELNTTGGETIRIKGVFNEFNIRKGSFKWSPSRSKINQLKGSIVDAAQGFKRVEITVNDRAHQRAVRQVNKKDVNLSGCDNFSQGSRLLHATLAENRDGGQRFKWTTDDAGIVYELGDCVAVNGQYVDSDGNVVKEFVNQPVTIEETNVEETYNVSFDARIYSSSLLDGQTGRRNISLSSTLKYFTEPPPVATNVVLTEFESFMPDYSVLSGIRGTFDFGAFAGAQFARLFLAGPSASAPADADYKELDKITPDSNLQGSFEIRSVPIGKMWVKIVTRSAFGKTAPSGHPVTSIVISQAPPQPTMTVTKVGNNRAVTWNPGVEGIFLPETYVIRIRDAGTNALMREHTIRLADFIPALWTYDDGAGDQGQVTISTDGSIEAVAPTNDPLNYNSQEFFGDATIEFEVDDRIFTDFHVVDVGTFNTSVNISNAHSATGDVQHVIADSSSLNVRRLLPNAKIGVRVTNQQPEYFLDDKSWMRGFYGPTAQLWYLRVGFLSTGSDPDFNVDQAFLRVRVKPDFPRQFVYTEDMLNSDFGSIPGTVTIELTQISAVGVESSIETVTV